MSAEVKQVRIRIGGRDLELLEAWRATYGYTHARMASAALHLGLAAMKDARAAEVRADRERGRTTTTMVLAGVRVHFDSPEDARKLLATWQGRLGPRRRR